MTLNILTTVAEKQRAKRAKREKFLNRLLNYLNIFQLQIENTPVIYMEYFSVLYLPEKFSEEGSI